MTSYSMSCPQCQATLKYQENLFGKELKCPRCQAQVTVPFPETVPLADEPELMAEVMEEGTEQEVTSALAGMLSGGVLKKKKKKKKKTKKQGWEMPDIVLEPIIWQALSAVVGLAVLVLVIYFLMRWPDAELLEQALWKQHDEAPYLKVMLPGTIKRETQQQAGITMQMISTMPKKEAVFGVAYSNGKLPPGRLQDGVEVILNDACNGSAANLEQMGAKEQGRKSIQLKEYPGKQLIMKVAEAKGYMIIRAYLVGPRLYMALVGGRGLHEKHPDVVRFFDSFEISEVLGQPAGQEVPAQGTPTKGAPPQQGPQVPPPARSDQPPPGKKADKK